MSKRFSIFLFLIHMPTPLLQAAEHKDALQGILQEDPHDTPNASFDRETPNASMEMSESELTVQEICASIRMQISTNPSSIDTPLDAGKTFIYTCFHEALYAAQTDKDFESYKELIAFLLEKGANLKVKDSDVSSLLNSAIMDRKPLVKKRVGILHPLFSTADPDVLKKQKADFEIDRKKKDAEAEIERKRKDAQAEIERQKKEAESEIARKRKEAEADDEIARKRKEAEAEIERKRRDAENLLTEHVTHKTHYQEKTSLFSPLLIGGCLLGVGIIVLIYFLPRKS